MQEIVNKDSFAAIVQKINQYPLSSLDCEATGLFPHKGDDLFSIAISTPDDDFYFNFYGGEDHLGGRFPEDEVLPMEWIPQIITNKEMRVFIHNAKYDMALCEKKGLPLTNVVCTLAMARVENNDRLNYTLEALTGGQKEAVKKYCDDNKLFEYITFEGMKKKDKKYFFQKVPRAIISSYAMKDSRLCFDLGVKQYVSIDTQAATMRKGADLTNVRDQEIALTPILFRMEQSGINFDLDYAHEFMDWCKGEEKRLKEEWGQKTGVEFKDSGVVFAKVFDEFDIHYPRTAKNNPSFDKAALDGMRHPLATIIKDCRSVQTKINYLTNFISNVGKDGRLHANIKQGGTLSGRMSCEKPPLQCVEKGDEDEDPKPYYMRRCFIPDEGCSFVMFDYDQMEYRLMLEYAKEMGIIEQVKGGMDVHTATANKVDIARKQAKTLNFLLLYGGGPSALCQKLFKPELPLFLLKEIERDHFWHHMEVGEIAKKHLIDYDSVLNDLEELTKAIDLRKQYFESLQKVKGFISGVKDTAKKRGFIFNWFGRKLRYNSQTYYSAPNGLIQGGCADVVKQAMLRIDKHLEGKPAKMLLQIHDELLFSVRREHLKSILEVKNIMESVFPYQHLKLTCGADFSDRSWQDKKELVLT